MKKYKTKYTFKYQLKKPLKLIMLFILFPIWFILIDIPMSIIYMFRYWTFATILVSVPIVLVLILIIINSKTSNIDILGFLSATLIPLILFCLFFKHIDLKPGGDANYNEK